MVGWLLWDPDRVAFTLPFLNRPVAWYGILFALGFLGGFYLLLHLLKRVLSSYPEYQSEKFLKKQSILFAERLTAYMVLSTVIGARLGHILFYEHWREYFLHPLEILKTWEGGLASHGAVIGILIGLFLFYLRIRREFPRMTLLRILDLIIIPSLFAGTLIRIGNFINQEVLGTVTTVPWAIMFGHPADGSFPLPRHPAQLYEAIFYLGALLFFWRFFPRLIAFPGRLSGIFFIAIFALRFCVEFVKEEQSLLLSHQFFTMGQILSLPMIILGIGLFWSSCLLKGCQRN